MKIFFSILLNASILFVIVYLLNTPAHPDSVLVTPNGFDSWKTYLWGGFVLGLLNFFVRPMLKLFGLPLFFIYPIVALGINAILLLLFEKTMNYILVFPGMTYEINGAINFAIATLIFTVLNVVYSILFSKT